MKHFSLNGKQETDMAAGSMLGGGVDNHTIEQNNPLIRDIDCSIRGPCMPANELYLHTEVA